MVNVETPVELIFASILPVTVKIPVILEDFSHIKSFTTISSPVVLVIATVLIPLTFLIVVT